MNNNKNNNNSNNIIKIIQQDPHHNLSKNMIHQLFLNLEKKDKEN
jgi:hypothetical protein